MLPRNLIIEWRHSVERALLVRFPPKSMYLSSSAEEMLNDLNQIELLGIQSLSVQKQIEGLRTRRNEISSRFSSVSKEERESLRQEVFKCKSKIQDLEEEHLKIETQCQWHENKIPNMPDENIPLWDNISDLDEKCIRTHLKFMRNLANEFNR